MPASYHVLGSLLEAGGYPATLSSSAQNVLLNDNRLVPES